MVQSIAKSAFLLVVPLLACTAFAGVDVQSLIDNAVKHGDSKLVLPSGEIRIDPPADAKAYHLNLQNAKHLEIVGDHTTLIFTRPRSGGLLFTNCEHISLRGVTLDWDPLPFTQGTIAALDFNTGTATVTVDKGFSDDPALFSRGCAGILYDPKDRLLKRQAWDLFELGITRVSDGTISLKCKSAGQLKTSGAAVSDLIAVRALSGQMAIRLLNCSDMVFNDVTIFTAPGMAIQEIGGEGGNQYTVTVTRGPAREGSQRLLSSNADALHSAGVHHGPAIVGCRLEYQGDDGIAIHGAYALIAKSSAADTLIASPKDNFQFAKGDRVRIYDGKTFTLKSEATVVSITKMPQPDAGLIAAITPIWKTYREDAEKKPYFQMTLDQPANVSAGDLISSPDRLGSGFLIQNNYLGHNRARGINVKASNGLIEKNLIEDIGSSGIAMGPEFAYWLEGDYVRDVTVRNNELRQIGISAAVVKHEKAIAVGAISVYALTPDHRLPGGTDNANLVIENNRIDSCGGIGLLLACTKNVDVRSNSISNTNLFSTLEGGKAFGVDPDAAIFVEPSQDVRFDANQLSGKGIVTAESKK